MAKIPELLDGHVTLEVECLDRLYLNGYIGPLATAGGLVTFMREQLGKPIPSPVVLGQVTEKFRDAVKAMAERQQIPIYQFDHKERKDDVADQMRRQRGVRDGIVFIGVAQEKAHAFSGKKIGGPVRVHGRQDGLREPLLSRKSSPTCTQSGWVVVGRQAELYIRDAQAVSRGSVSNPLN